MDYEPDNISRRDQVLANFRESLTRPLSDRYYDEDELLEIFDFAGDIGDDYLRMEALLCAARYFPDSDAFNQRKAIFYNQYSDDSGDKYIDDNSSATGMIWDIMRARRMSLGDSDAIRSVLDTIVDSYDDFTDEEVIQLIDLVSQSAQIQWLKDNMDKLRSKAAFVNILLYESAIASDANMDVLYAAKLLEELTEIEPFNFYFWLMLTKEYEALDEGEKALSAVDYALALNPDDIQSLFTKAKLLLAGDRPVSQVMDILNDILRISPDFTEAVKMLAFIYSSSSQPAMAKRLLSEHVARYPDSVLSIVPDLIKFRPDNIRELLDRFYIANEENSQVLWATWAHQMTSDGYRDVAIEILDAYERNSGIRVFSLSRIENFFIQKRFGETIFALNEYITNTDSHELDMPVVATMHLISMVKLGEYEAAQNFCDFVLSNASKRQSYSIGESIDSLGMYQIVKTIKDKLSITRNPADWEDFDPLNIW